MPHRRIQRLFVATSIAAAIAFTVLAEPPSLDHAERRQVIDELCSQLTDGYIYSETAEKMVSKLRQSQQAEAYAHFTSPAALASQLTHDLQAISHDKHLRIRHASQQRGGGSPPPRRMVRRRVVVDGERPAKAQIDGTPSQPAPQPRRMAGRPRGTPLLGRVDVLDGNIGYLEVRHFDEEEAAIEVFDRAMTQLQGVDALIIDLGKNPGGTPFAVRYLSTYFFAEPTHLASEFRRGWAEPNERWTFDTVPGERFTEIPVYVLTSHFTFSAAESFTFGLKNHDRIIQVGEKTGGGGHWGEQVELGHGFQVFLPIGRTYNPATGQGWEATGLTPDKAVPYAEAYDTALEMAKHALERPAGRS